METTNYKQLIQKRQTTLRGMICRLTGLTNYEVNELMFDMGTDYIVRTSLDPAISDAFLKEPMYWNWWKQQWALVDECFWKKFSDNIDRDNVRAFLVKKYKELHDRIDAYPDKIVYEKIHNTYMFTTMDIINKNRNEPTE